MRVISLLSLLFCVICASAQELSFSVPHGFYDKPFNLSIAGGGALLSDGGSIHYTLDGSVPTKDSKLYTEPLTIKGNTILRAGVIAGDTLATPVTTATYLFMDDILEQPDYPAGYPTTWGKYTTISGTAKADYGMDPEMTGNATLAAKIKEGLLSLPVLSIVTDKDNLFSHVNDPDKGGIYIFTGPPVGDNTGNGWTRPASAELFGLSHDFSVTCGLRLHGGHGRLAEKNPKHSMRLVFKKDYGKKSLEYPLYGDDEPNKFNQLILRCHFGNSWQHWSESNRQKAQYTRDVWARRMQRKIGWTSVNALYVHLFLNGMYWGLYNIAERVDDQFGKDRLGGKKEDIDVIKVEEEGGNHLEAAEGGMDAWDLMISTARKAADDAYYYELQGKNADGEDNPEKEALLDVDNFIDYMLINQYGGNTDWDHHNWYAIRKKGKDSQGFRFLCWDSELILDNPTQNVMNVNNGNSYPTGIFHNLLNNKQFATRYYKRAKELFADDGYLGAKSAEALWDSLYNVVSLAVYAEAARWGDYRRDVHPYDSKGSLYTVDGTYMTERKRLHNNYFPNRSANVMNMVKAKVNMDDSDLFEPGDGWVALAPSMFHRWDGVGGDAHPLQTSVPVDWNMRVNAVGGTAVAGFGNVEYDRYADVSGYEKLVILGTGSGLRILANRLVDHGSWKQIIVSFNANDKYWDKDLEAISVPLSDLRTMNDTDGKARVEDFVHLHVLKVDWTSSANIRSVWLIPSQSASLDNVICDSHTGGDNKFRNIQGQIVVPNKPGIYIREGKKYLFK